MGSSASKASRAAGSVARKYPTAAPLQAATTNAPPARPPPAQNRQPGPTVRPQPRASGTRDEAINLDASDPDFARSLRQLGAVQPNPTLSESSTFHAQQPSFHAAPGAHQQNPQYPSSPSFPGQQHGQRIAPDPRTNPALVVLEARARIQDEAEQEFVDAVKRGHAGRQFLDVFVVRQILQMRERGQSEGEIEKRLGLRKGVVGRLGVEGLVGTTGMV